MIACHLSASSSQYIDFSFGANKTQRAILQYLGEWLPLFLKWSNGRSFAGTQEDDISEELEWFLQEKVKSTNLLLNLNRKKGSDFRFRIDGMGVGTQSVFLMEAKRLPPTSTRDYVHHHGSPGGISRFKLEQVGFGDHLAFSAMLGYVQKNDFEHWFNQVNLWIADLMAAPDEVEMKWGNEDKLLFVKKDKSIAEYRSIHTRISKAPIRLTHFWLNMVC
ncbi:MAG: hypothetical protein WC701_04035 [Kiritimatiellales bacterium]|jgi:hypothetical protein